MFVESMSFEEIRKELDRDKQFLISKVVHHSARVLKQMRKTNQTTYNKFFDYVTPRKNRWVYQFIATSNKEKDFEVHNYCCFMTKRSYAALISMITNDKVFYYTSHFFRRYFERLEHEKDAVHDIIRMFLNENERVATTSIKDLGNGVHRVFAQLTTGVGLGYHYQRLNLTEMRTFITNDMLKKTSLSFQNNWRKNLRYMW